MSFTQEVSQWFNTTRGGAEHFSNFCIPMFQRYMTSHPVAKSAELVDQRRFKMDAWCHLVSSLFSPTVNHDFVCCVLSMLQRYFASYFSQYFGKTNMLSIILTINDTQLRGTVMAIFFALSKRVVFKILALAVSDSMKALIKIAYPGWNIMEKTLEVTV